MFLPFGAPNLPPTYQSPEARRQHLVQVINSALEIVSEINLGHMPGEEGETQRQGQGRPHHEQVPPRRDDDQPQQ